MRSLLLICVLQTGLFSLGCASRSTPATHIVVLIDMSASVEMKSRDDSLRAIVEWVRNLRRGDRLSVIPILGNEAVEAPGRVVRIGIPRNREPYDADVTRLRKDFEQQVEQLKSAKPSLGTDIFGSVRLGTEELQLDAPACRRIIVLLSDFVEDDGRANFAMDRSLSTDISAAALGAAETRGLPKDLANVTVYLGSLRSMDTKRMTAQRRHAIYTFWQQYLARQGAAFHYFSDGPGMITFFLRAVY